LKHYTEYKVLYTLKENYMSVGSMKTEFIRVPNNGTSVHGFMESRYGDVFIFATEEITNQSIENHGGNSNALNTKDQIKIGVSLVLIMLLWVLVKNIINFDLISKYDTQLYFSNITHFSSDYKRKVTDTDIVVSATYPEKYIGKKYEISKNKIVFYNGYKETGKEIERLTAIYFYVNEIKIYGYVKHEKDIELFKSIDPKITLKINENINSRYKKELETNIQLYKAKADANITTYCNGSHTLDEVLRTSQTKYFYCDEDSDIVNSIKNKYYEDEIYEKDFFRLGNEYYKSVNF